MTSPNKNPKKNWADMVAASRRESPSPVEVRYGVRAELESILRSGTAQLERETDWIHALVSLFNPGFVRIGVAAVFVCMLAIDVSTTVSSSEPEPAINDPLVTLYSGEGEWSDWL